MDEDKDCWQEQKNPSGVGAGGDGVAASMSSGADSVDGGGAASRFSTVDAVEEGWAGSLSSGADAADGGGRRSLFFFDNVGSICHC